MNLMGSHQFYFSTAAQFTQLNRTNDFIELLYVAYRQIADQILHQTNDFRT